MSIGIVEEKPMSEDAAELAKKAKIIRANYILQAKIGRGPLDEKAVRRGQAVIDSNAYDFAPLGEEYLLRLERAIIQAADGGMTKDEAVETMTEAIMQLKANAPTFRYALVGKLANIMLGFLEAIEGIDKDVIAIVEAHHTTLKAIIAKKMEGDGGPYGRKLEGELKDVIHRYFEKKNK